MKFIDFPEANFTFTKPENMTDDECGSLRVWRGETEPNEQGNSFPNIISCWELSDDDVANILRDRKIYLRIVSNGMPPVSIQTETPFIQKETEPV